MRTKAVLKQATRYSAIALCLSSLAACVTTGDKVESNEQADLASFKGFEPVTADTKDVKRRTLASAWGKDTLVPYSRMALNSEFAGVAISDPQYFSWCTSPLEVDGKIHLFNCRWPATPEGMAPWKTHSEMVHYVGDSPEGPFKFAGKVLTNDDLKDTGYISPHNVRLERVDDKFVVLYVCRPKGPDENTPSASYKQRVGMLIADKIEGPWRQVGVVVHPSETPGTATYKSKRGTCNPAFIKVGDKYHIYFKYIDASAPKGSYAVATSDHLEGPYTVIQRCMDNVTWVEDAQGFEWNGKYYLLTDDNHGHNGGIFGAQMLWKSDDGLFFKREDAVISTGTIFDYWKHSKEEKKELMAKEPFTRHPTGKFERPAFLFQNGKPTYFYAVGDVNINGGKTPEVYVVKIKDSASPESNNSPEK